MSRCVHLINKMLFLFKEKKRREKYIYVIILGLKRVGGGTGLGLHIICDCEVEISCVARQQCTHKRMQLCDGDGRLLALLIADLCPERRRR